MKEKPHTAVFAPRSSISDICLVSVGKAPVSPVSSRPPMYSGQVKICPFVSIFQTIIFITQCELPLRLCELVRQETT